MSETRSFQFALLVSFLFHSVLFIRLPSIPFLPSRRSLEKVEITYFKIQEMPKPQQISRSSETSVKRLPLPEIKKEEILEPKTKVPKKAEAPLEKPPVKKETHLEERPKELAETEKDVTKKPIFISYYRVVREKIKSRADEKFLNTKNFQEGEVYLSFVVASNGELLELRVVDEMSTETPFLKKVAVESVRDASPFPDFPKELNQSQITFNVIISFELK